MTQDSLFPEMGAKPKEKTLVDAIECVVDVFYDVPHLLAVKLRTRGGAEHWCPRSSIIHDGLGEQRVQIERWKAREIGLVAEPKDPKSAEMKL